MIEAHFKYRSATIIDETFESLEDALAAEEEALEKRGAWMDKMREKDARLMLAAAAIRFYEKVYGLAHEPIPFDPSLFKPRQDRGQTDLSRVSLVALNSQQRLYQAIAASHQCASPRGTTLRRRSASPQARRDPAVPRARAALRSRASPPERPCSRARGGSAAPPHPPHCV